MPGEPMLHRLLRFGRALVVGAALMKLAFNYGIFRFLAPRLTTLPPEVVSFLGAFVVFVSFAYPVRERSPDA